MIALFPLLSYIKLAYNVGAFWQMMLLKIKHTLFKMKVAQRKIDISGQVNCVLPKSA